MKHEELQKLNDLLLKYYSENYPNRMELNRTLVLKDIQNKTEFDNFSGIKLGHSTSKVGFFGVTPVGKSGAISSPTGGATVDSQARTAIDSIRTALTQIGITA